MELSIFSRLILTSSTRTFLQRYRPILVHPDMRGHDGRHRIFCFLFWFVLSRAAFSFIVLFRCIAYIVPGKCSQLAFNCKAQTHFLSTHSLSCTNNESNVNTSPLSCSWNCCLLCPNTLSTYLKTKRKVNRLLKYTSSSIRFQKWVYFLKK